MVLFVNKPILAIINNSSKFKKNTKLVHRHDDSTTATVSFNVNTGVVGSVMLVFCEKCGVILRIIATIKFISRIWRININIIILILIYSFILFLLCTATSGWKDAYNSPMGSITSHLCRQGGCVWEYVARYFCRQFDAPTRWSFFMWIPGIIQKSHIIVVVHVVWKKSIAI